MHRMEPHKTVSEVSIMTRKDSAMKLATHASHCCISLTLQSNNNTVILVILHTVTVAVFMQNYYFKYFLLIILVDFTQVEDEECHL